MSKRPLIPKIIHQIWLGPKEPPRQWMATWPAFHPHWEYKLWTDDNLPVLYNQKQFDKIKSWSGKADILRVELLYRWGGVYIDADCECLNPLDDRLLNHPFFVCYENELVRPGLIQNNVIGSVPGHPILQEAIHALEKIEDVNEGETWVTVGPYFFTKVIKYYQTFQGGSVKILPSYKFAPVHYSGSCYLGKGKVYATHHWVTTSTGSQYEKSRFGFSSKGKFKIEENESKNHDKIH